ncbi:conserved hypothetical protein [Paraburkholderia sabiae]|uniref:DUF5343 domain-containing protein n=1 Tax=Paraburkholderia sabiae TaxID=273251 RepID=UPI001CB12363|nr:DUF5343 domain-containing protein [Paraburkholderia sabiae]CAG9214730.1 conserved hypothetical protein [Paraburkholderia sabiae]
MAASLPYLVSYKNVERLFSGISAAKVPDNFTQTFLAQTLGLKASGDRPFIPLMRTLGFIDASGRPTASYRELKNPQHAKVAIANAIRMAYAPLFAANEAAHTLSSEQLRGLIAQVAGTDEEMTKRIAYTFTALSKQGEFATTSRKTKADANETDEQSDESDDEQQVPIEKLKVARRDGLRPEFHYNFQIHLPANGTEETYLSIFNALRKVFQ